jgi:hypothetical protein
MKSNQLRDPPVHILKAEIWKILMGMDEQFKGLARDELCDLFDRAAREDSVHSGDPVCEVGDDVEVLNDFEEGEGDVEVDENSSTDDEVEDVEILVDDDGD